MKKVILTLGVLGLISATACKKEVKTTDEAMTGTMADSAAMGTTTGMDSATMGTTTPETTAPATGGKMVNGVAVPTFSNPEVQQFGDEYAAFLEETMAASKSGDAAKIQALTAKSQEWATKQAAMSSKMTADDAQKLSDFAMKVAQSGGMTR